MKKDRDDRLAAMRRELLEQDRAWEAAKAAVAGLGHVRIAVSRQRLDEIDAATRTPSRPVFGVRG